jgi:hypothetical protein
MFKNFGEFGQAINAMRQEYMTKSQYATYAPFLVVLLTCCLQAIERCGLLRRFRLAASLS